MCGERTSNSNGTTRKIAAFVALSLHVPCFVGVNLDSTRPQNDSHDSKKGSIFHWEHPPATDLPITYNPLWTFWGLWHAGLYLSQHFIILHVVHLVGVDLSFQGVLVEFPADVDQQGGGAGVYGAAQRGVADVPGNVDAVAQDHADKQAWGGKLRRREVKEKRDKRDTKGRVDYWCNKEAKINDEMSREDVRCCFKFTKGSSNVSLLFFLSK